MKEKEQGENKSKKYKKIIIILLIVIIIACGAFVIAINRLNRIIMDRNNMQLDKPVIYLYPEEKTELTVKLGYPEKLTCSYPEYSDSWNVIANPDGTLLDTKTGRELYSLYWEGIGQVRTDISEGFIVKGEDTISFLEEKLEILGLTDKEAEEFIIYWLPVLQDNAYNYIRFATKEEIDECMPLEISKEPDTMIRILMQYKVLDEKIEVKEQVLETPTRNGFVVVEWGGTEIK